MLRDGPSKRIKQTSHTDKDSTIKLLSHLSYESSEKIFITEFTQIGIGSLACIVNVTTAMFEQVLC